MNSHCSAETMSLNTTKAFDFWLKTAQSFKRPLGTLSQDHMMIGVGLYVLIYLFY